MAYKWKPSKTQRREFAEKMQDEDFANQYYLNKTIKAENRRKTSEFDYNTAGGFYIPTNNQYKSAIAFLNESGTKLSTKQIEGCNNVIFGYSCNEKVHHDNIHIVNELIRSKSFI